MEDGDKERLIRPVSADGKDTNESPRV